MSAETEAGMAALQQGNIAAAISSLETAVQHDPSDFLARLYLGAAYGQASRYQEAVASITQAVHLQPANAQARYNLGVALEHGGWTEQALTAFQQAVQLQPNYPQAQEAIRRLQPAPVPTLDIPNPTSDPAAGYAVTGPATAAPASAYAASAPAAYNDPLQAPPAYAPTANPVANPYGSFPPASPMGPAANPYGVPPIMGQPAYHPMASAFPMAEPNIGMGALAGAGVALACGIGFGFVSVAAGFRIPYLTILIGYIVGYAVLKASKAPGPTQGMIAGGCAVVSTLIGLGIMHLAGIIVSPLALLLVVYAGFRGYRIADS
ncbi:MAG TPA: tetratricopeptide repeat protein [Chthonomonadaceae bacterium]|nr:tetratricopeptide repeat protein [Chthonomonadaceae bacterium]